MRPFLLAALIIVLFQLQTLAFRNNCCKPGVSNSNTELYYDYFKKGPEKKEIGRIWKNIIFPGIYVEYADTKEPMKTVKIDTKEEEAKNANAKKLDRTKTVAEDFDGKYNIMDPRMTVKEISASQIQTKKLGAPMKPANFVAPTPKKATTVKLGTGLSVLPNIASFPRPKKPLILFEAETDSECKKIREIATVLDLTVEYRPCPGGVSGWSDFMWTLSKGRRTLPFLVDNNPSMYKPQIFGGKDIAEYLFNTYGPGDAEIPANLQVKANGQGGGNGFFSNSKGSKLRPNARSDLTKLKPLTLYGWEGAQYVTPVRQTLSELGLAHIFVNCANGSQNREALMKRNKDKIFQVPYLIDPNTGIEMFESVEMIKYLEQVYTV